MQKHLYPLKKGFWKHRSNLWQLISSCFEMIIDLNDLINSVFRNFIIYTC